LGGFVKPNNNMDKEYKLTHEELIKVFETWKANFIADPRAFNQVLEEVDPKEQAKEFAAILEEIRK
jgi:hypothetical protein